MSHQGNMTLESDKSVVTSNSELFQKISFKDKILFLVNDFPNIKQSDLLPLLLKSVVTLLPKLRTLPSENWTQGGEADGNKGNLSNKVTSVFVPLGEEENIKEKLKMTIYRETEIYKTILVDKSVKPYTYSLSTIGKQKVMEMYNEWQSLMYAQLKAAENKEYYSRMHDLSVCFFKQPNIYQELLKSKYEQENYVYIDFSDVSKFDPILAEFLLDSPTDFFNLIESVIDEDFKGVSILIKGLPESCNINITHIRVKDLSKLRSVYGEIRSRSPSAVQISKRTYECPSCGQRVTMYNTDGKIPAPASCPCGRKGKWEIIHQEEQDSLRLTISDLYENLTTNEVPEEINVILKQDFYKFSKLNEGDRVKISCIPVLEPLKKKDDSFFRTKMLECVGMEKIGDDDIDMFISKEDEESFNEILKNPLKWHKDLLYPDLIGVDLPIKIATIGLYCDKIHILYVGKPGTGKSEICRRSADACIRGKFVSCISASSSGILGAATKNQFTGKFSLDGGVFRPMHPGGKVILDELNRDTEYEIQKACMGVMNDQKLNLHKANIQIDTPCHVSVWATANPVGEYDTTYTNEYDNFKLLHPLWDRFDFIVYFNNELDVNDDNLLCSLMMNHKKEFVIDPKMDILLKKYQIKAKSIKVNLEKEDIQKIVKIYQEFSNKIDHSFRRINTLKGFMEGICRMHHRTRPNDEDFVLMTDILCNLSLEKNLFKENNKRR